MAHLIGTATGDRGVHALHGADGDDLIEGLGGDDELFGGDGDDVLDGGTGGTGGDIMRGGLGNDTYYLDNADDVVREYSGQGVDTVVTRGSYILGDNLENLVLDGHADRIGSGNALDNHLTGNDGANVLDGGDGNDRLDGGLGADILRGGTGNDTYFVDNSDDEVREYAGQGRDTVLSSVTFRLGANIETLSLTGMADLRAVGNAQDNHLIGNDGNNALYGEGGDDFLRGGAGDDILVGGAGLDSLNGGTGNDIYFLRNGSGEDDTVHENAGEGIDEIRADINYNLPANIENLTLSGMAIYGNGNNDANVITGNYRSNRIDGKVGADTMMGGAGNDTYYVDNSGDRVVENSAEGFDQVQVSSRTGITFSMGANVENMTADGAGTFDLTGNNLDNVIALNGGDYVLAGGGGGDTYVFSQRLMGHAVITDYSDDDVIRIFDTHNQGPVTRTQVGADAVLDLGNGKYIRVENQSIYALAVQVNALPGHVGTSGHDDIAGTREDDTLLGLDGNDAIHGGGGNDYIDGGTGADWMVGRYPGSQDPIDSAHPDNDTYVVDNIGDTVTETYAGDFSIDTVRSSISYVLGANLEVLVLTGTADLDGTGNALNNSLIGNAGNNRLDGGSGDDTLTGGGGRDQLFAGDGNDVLSGGQSADVFNVSPLAGQTQLINDFKYSEHDKINIVADYSEPVVYTLTQVGADAWISIEGGGVVVVKNHSIDDGHFVTSIKVNGRATIYGNSGNNNLFTPGGDVVIWGGDGDDVLHGSGYHAENGNSGDDYLDGGTGTDIMYGGTYYDTGNDIYVVDNVGDVVIDETSNRISAARNHDLVLASISYTLGDTIENLTLIGTGDINGTGNGRANVLAGNSGHNILRGGAGGDTFVFTQGSGADTVADFRVGQNDRIDVSDYTHGTPQTAIISQAGADTLIDLGGGNVITIRYMSATDTAFLDHIIW